MRCKRVADAGHEIGVHGYSHENPIAMTPDQEEAVLVKCIDLIVKLTGKRPRGYIAPWWELSPATAGLLLKHGFLYDHSMMHNDFTPYYVRVGDSWTKIDYSKQADGVDEAARSRHRDRSRSKSRRAGTSTICRR